MIALLVFVNASILAMAWVSLDASYRQYQDRAAVTSRNTNRLVSQSVAGDIDRINLALRTVIDEVARVQETGETVFSQTMDAFLTRLHARLPMADSVRLSNAHGDVVAGAGGVPQGISVANRNYFIRLRDDGIGIESTYFDKVFVIFQRLYPQKFPEGTGIGLALCRRIVQRFGGTIWVESEPGKGATFFFTLQNGSAVTT